MRRFGRTPVWREGSIDDLADTLRNTDLARQRIPDSIERTVREVADMLLRDGCALDITNALVLPRTKKDRHAATLVGSLMLSNAALLHRRLRLAPDLVEVAPLEDILGSPETAPGLIRDEWRKILRIDRHPVFSPAVAVLNAISDVKLGGPVRRIGENAIAVADELAALRFDHAGPLYHRLLSSSRSDSSFYKSHVSALLLARLALTEDFADWSDADSLARLRVIDPACGTGTLLMAPMHTVRDRHEPAAGAAADSDPLHLVLVEDILHGLDINRHGVQLAACNLTLGNPRVDYRRMNLYTMQYGPLPDGKAKAGSLEFLATARDSRDIACLSVPLPTAEGVDAERAEPGAAPTESITGLFDPVIMNPPFTRNDIRNRQYGSLARRTLQRREIEIAEFIESRDGAAYDAIDQTSVRTFFSPLADILLKDCESTLALVAPTTALTSAFGIPEREFLADRLQIESVITSHDPDRINFSDNTAIHESLLIARRPGPERGPTRFVSLARMPRGAHEAILLADLIDHRRPLSPSGTEHSWPWPRVRRGDWSPAQFFDSVLAEAIRDLVALAETLSSPRERSVTSNRKADESAMRSYLQSVAGERRPKDMHTHRGSPALLHVSCLGPLRCSGTTQPKYR